MDKDMKSRLGRALRVLPLALAGTGPAGLPGTGREARAASREPAPRGFPDPEPLDRAVAWGKGGFDYSAVPPREPGGALSVTVNGGVPFFGEGDFGDGARLGVPEVDALGRSQGAFVVVDRTTAKVDAGDERPSNRGLPTPTGWHDTEYSQMRMPRLYDHSHVAGWALAKQHFRDEGNVITATTALNRSGMKPYENLVLKHVRRLYAEGGDERVLYRATPVFEGGELVARGLLVEAASLPDRGASLLVCAWCYNVKDGVEIDYATGGSRYVGEPAGAAAPAPAGGGLERAALTAGGGWVARVAGRVLGALSGALAGGGGSAGPAAAGGAYIADPAAAEFHRAGRACAPVSGSPTSAGREDLIEAGYRPCERCRP